MATETGRLVAGKWLVATEIIIKATCVINIEQNVLLETGTTEIQSTSVRRNCSSILIQAPGQKY